MIYRTISEYLKKDASYYPVVTLTGPRQSGKTTLAKAVFSSHRYVSLEDQDNRIAANEDPRGFLNRFDKDVIIDEVQRAPDLCSYIQTASDSDPRPGRYILTGSQNLLLMESISQSLAGRCAVLHLLPFSFKELELLQQAYPQSPRDLFTDCTTQRDCWTTIRTGFYPRIHDRHIPPEIWLGDYIRTYVERDVRRIVNVGEIETFERFLSLCAGRVGQLLNFSSIASDCGIAVDTARRWISILKTSFLVFLLRPHHLNFSKRIIKSPKLYFYDTGLVCRLLGIRTDEQLMTHPLRGAIFENYVIAEIVKAYTHQRREAPVYFWRDQTGHEIDLILEEAGELYPIEIKSAATMRPAMFETLNWWLQLAEIPRERATLVYGGKDAYTYKDIRVQPWFSI